MDPPNIGAGMFNTAVFETDLEGNVISSDGDLPFWLRDIIDRAFNTSGIRIHRKVATADAIASLEDVETPNLEDESCPICYDPYVTNKNKKLKTDGSVLPSVEAEDPRVASLDAMVRELVPFGVKLSTATESSQFNDPSLFMPIDPGAQDPVRFPQRNLHTYARVPMGEMFPSMGSKKEPARSRDGLSHTPVKMPNCSHVFGKPCIMEWLGSNVSCPVCRKEVEAVQDSDPISVKIASIKRNCNFIFTQDPEAMVSHLVEHLTDVFNPHRRPHNPAITPLTDSLLSQAWATPSYPAHLVPDRTETSDPLMIMARKFPLSYFRTSPVIHRATTTRGPARTQAPN